MSIAILPRRQNPWMNVMPSLLGNLVLNQIGHKQRMDVLDKQLAAEKQATEVQLKMKGYTQGEAGLLKGGKQPEFFFNEKPWHAPEEKVVPLKVGGQPVEGMFAVMRGNKITDIRSGPTEQGLIQQYEYARAEHEANLGPGGGPPFETFTDWKRANARAGAMQLGERVNTAAAVKEATAAIQDKYNQAKLDQTFRTNLYMNALKAVKMKAGEDYWKISEDPATHDVHVFSEANRMVTEKFQMQGKKVEFRAWAEVPGWYDTETGELLNPWSRPHSINRPGE